MAIRVNDDNEIVEEGGNPLIPGVARLTAAVLDGLTEEDRRVVEVLKKEIKAAGDSINIETILTQVRRLAQAIGRSTVHGLNGPDYDELGRKICERIGQKVRGNPAGFSQPLLRAYLLDLPVHNANIR